MSKPRPNRLKRKTPPGSPVPRAKGTPPRRIEADLSQQAPSNTYSPRTYYEDAEFRCRDCGKLEVWTAEQQRWWYEVAKGPVQSKAVRCGPCRAARRAAMRGTPPKAHQQRRAEGKR